MEATVVRRPAARGTASPRLLRLAGDEKLVSLVRSGDESAFEQVYDRYHQPILSFCRHMLGDRDEGEDAVQHTFLAAYRDLTSSDKPIQLKAWLFTIARNRCYSILRARREQANIDDVEPATEGLAAEVQRRQDLQELLRDMARLPDDQRAALVLSEIGALGHDEIADVLGCRKEKVKALVFQARTSLSDSRQARETPCSDIREQLSTLKGGALRRKELRRHLRECSGCREYQAEVKRQRAAMAVLLPVVPTAALKGASLPASVLAGAGAGGAAAGGGGAAGLLGAKSLAAKGVIVAALAAGGTAGSVAVIHSINSNSGGRQHAPAVNPASSAGEPGSAHHSSAGLAGAAAAATGTARHHAAARHANTASNSRHHGKALGHHKSSTGPGNSVAAHQNALSHGKGHKRGLNGTQPGHAGRAHHGNGKAVGHTGGKSQSAGRSHSGIGAAKGHSHRSSSGGSTSGSPHRAPVQHRPHHLPTPKPSGGSHADSSKGAGSGAGKGAKHAAAGLVP